MTQTPAAGGHTGRRLLIVLAVVLVVAALVAGAAVLFIDDRPSIEAATPMPTATTPPASATPSATPAVAAAPSVRVPTTCEDMLPSARAAELLDTEVSLVEPRLTGTPATNPGNWADERAGALTCEYQATADDPSTARAVFVLIVPDTTLDDVVATATGEPGGTPDPGISPTALSVCSQGFGCTMWDQVGPYGLSFGLRAPAVAEDAQGFAAEASDLVAAIAALPAPDPLWQPQGATLTGADSCDSLVDQDLLVDVLGPSERVFKADEGEYSLSSFGTNARVGSFWCSWTGDGGSGASAAVLPGGASFLDPVLEASEVPWLAAPDLPGQAFLTADGTTAHILIDSGWVRVTVSLDLEGRLPELVASVMDHVGAS
jgi:hypothetical protein